MSSMKVKKGITWLQRDFEKQLKKELGTNVVVDTRNMIKFIGRDKVIENMISRGELEEASYSDVQLQKQTENIRKKQAVAEKNRQEQMREEEIKLKKVMGL